MSAAARSALALLLLIAAGAAGAQTQLMAVQDFVAPPGDASLALLEQIIGSPSVGPKALFKEPMNVFLMAVLAFSSLIFGYVALVGTLQSAHDGVLLGKKWSTVWLPIRFAAGFILLFPTADGLCLAQQGMRWGVEQGVAIASTAWLRAINGFVESGSAHVAVRSADTADVRRAVAEVMKAEICTQHLRDHVLVEPQLAGRMVTRGSESFIATTAASFLGKEFNGGRIEWGPYPGQGSGYRTDVCGAIEIPNTQNLNPAIKAHAVADGWGLIQINAMIVAANVLAPVAKECTSLESIRDRDFQACPLSAYVDALDRATKAYSDHIAVHFDRTVRTQNEKLHASIERDARENGWLTAGWHYYQIARISEDLNRATTSVPTVFPMRFGDGFVNRQAVAEKLGGFNSGPLSVMDVAAITAPVDAALEMSARLLSGALDEYASQTSDLGDRMSEIDTTAGGSISRNSVANGIRSVTHLFFGLDSNAADDSSRHFGYDPNNPAPAIVQLKTLGDYFMGIGMAGFAAIGIADGAKDLIGAAGPKGAAVKAVISRVISDAAKPIAYTALGLMIAFGAILALWVPMLPFAIWLGQSIGWFISVLEMLIATPIWIAAHMHPDGEGMSSRQSASGYMIIIELIARPTLMLFGLIIAMIAVDPLLSLVAVAFYPFFATIIADSQASPLTWVWKIGAYSMFSLMVMNMVFKSIVAVPDNVMRWIGGMTDSRNAEGGALGDAARTVVVAGTMRAATTGGGAMATYAARTASKAAPSITGNTISPR